LDILTQHSSTSCFFFFFLFCGVVLSATRTAAMSFQDSDETTSKESAFDAPAAWRLVMELRGAFASGKTRSYDWRVTQLKALEKLVTNHEPEIVDALRKDLAKPPLETVAYEVLLVIPLSLLLSAFYFLCISGACHLGSGRGMFRKLFFTGGFRDRDFVRFIYYGDWVMPCVTTSDSFFFLFSEQCFLCAVLTCCIEFFWGYFYLFILVFLEGV